ncbi:MAG: hypothetical protein AAAB35_23240 [Phyllobacterium sp.]|uniref:hypothetical protein n=1 Tax=Phyllobacterium sp. TaxID=1871046 RepID=UPI0030F150D3
MLLGIVFSEVLMRLAVWTAFMNHSAGLGVLTLVALTQLVTTVSMIQIVRPGLPSIAHAQAISLGRDRATVEKGLSRLATIITVALLPFFAYYAAWGFLGDTIRQYSRLALAYAPFGEAGGNVLDVLDSKWLILSVAISWVVRKFAKMIQGKTQRSIWRVIIVVCETNWIFIGLYVISRWKDMFLTWLGTRNIGNLFDSLWTNYAHPVGSAYAAVMIPVEQTSVTMSSAIINLFFYGLLPVIWLVMVALVYGYDVRDDTELMRVHHRVERFGERYKAIPKFLRDFVEHFIGGYRSRYLPIANGVRLTLNSGLMLIITLIVGYRFIDWAAAWAWIGMTRLIGPNTLDTWQVLSEGVSLLFGSPFQDSSTGILVEPLRICFLAAVIETAFSMAKRSRPAEAAEASVS